MHVFNLRGTYGSGNLGSSVLAGDGIAVPVYDETELGLNVDHNRRFVVVIPVYNHADSVDKIVRQAMDLHYPIFVVNDGSTDSTAQKLSEIQEINVITHEKNMGKGAAILSGFNITDGYADGSTDEQKNGGGIYNDYGSPTLEYCTVRKNYAYYDGGGIYNQNSSPFVSNCIFTRNSAGGGGGIYNNDNSNPTVSHCIFRCNG